MIHSPERIPGLDIIIIYHGKGEVRVQTAHEVRLQKDSGEPQGGCASGDSIDLLLATLTAPWLFGGGMRVIRQGHEPVAQGIGMCEYQPCPGNPGRSRGVSEAPVC